MGYISEVLLAIAFADKAHRDEVLAVYAMDQNVQKHDLLKEWKQHDYEDGEASVYCLWFSADYVKWYDSYEDVQGFERMSQVAADFAEHRDFPYAWLKYRIGENYDDIETDALDDDPEGTLRDYLWDMCGIECRIRNDFDK